MATQTSYLYNKNGRDWKFVFTQNSDGVDVMIRYARFVGETEWKPYAEEIIEDEVIEQ